MGFRCGVSYATLTCGFWPRCPGPLRYVAGSTPKGRCGSDGPGATPTLKCAPRPLLTGGEEVEQRAPVPRATDPPVPVPPRASCCACPCLRHADLELWGWKTSPCVTAMPRADRRRDPRARRCSARPHRCCPGGLASCPSQGADRVPGRPGRLHRSDRPAAGKSWSSPIAVDGRRIVGVL